MRWIKKIIRAILNLLPVLSILFIVNGNSSALRHDYDGLWISENNWVPHAVLDSDTNQLVLPSESPNGFDSLGSSIISLRFLQSEYDFNPNITRFQNDFYLDTSATSGPDMRNGFVISSFPNCVYYTPSTARLHNTLSAELVQPSSSSNFIRLDLYNSSNFTDGFSGIGRNPCLTRDYQSSHHVTLSSNNLKMPYPSTLSGVNTFNSQLSPYTSSYEGLKLHKTEVSSSDGLTYSHSFSFSRLYQGDQPNKFYFMTLPLNEQDSYFMDKSNLYSGRHFEFKLLFKFDGSFSWNPDLSQGYSHIRASGYSPSSSDSLWSDSVYTNDYDCTNNLVQVSGHTQLEISCPVTLDRDYLAWIPSYEIYNPGYVWDSDSWWEFFGFYVVTDNDDTPGRSFNSHLAGDLWSPTNGVGGDGSCASSDLICQLNNLFVFSIPVSSTPLGGILGNFSDGSSCASIPTIAGLIHSNETQVCPWFSSSVRSIATPILSLFSACLVFQFVVKWLKSGSGNFLEDSGGN